MYPKVPQSYQKYLKVPQSTKKYLKVPKSTSKYPKVPQRTQKYLKVPKRERIHVYYIDIKQVCHEQQATRYWVKTIECTGPGQFVGPTWRKINKFSSWSLGGEGDRVAPGRLAHPCTRRCGRRRSSREQRCLT